METFSEKRQTCWAFEPYLGGNLDSQTSLEVPNVWDISAKPTACFQNQVSQMEVPNTASLRMCHICGGVGRKRCLSCNGDGWVGHDKSNIKRQRLKITQFIRNHVSHVMGTDTNRASVMASRGNGAGSVWVAVDSGAGSATETGGLSARRAPAPVSSGSSCVS